MSEPTQPAQKLIWHYVTQITDTVFEGETPNARLQQLGLLLTIYALQGDPDPSPVTAQRLTQLLGIEPSQVTRLVLKLVKRGLVERQPIHNRLGKGRVYALTIRETPELAALLKAFARAPTASN